MKDTIYQKHDCTGACAEMPVLRTRKSGGDWVVYRWGNPMVSLKHCPHCGELLEVVRDAEGH